MHIKKFNESYSDKKIWMNYFKILSLKYNYSKEEYRIIKNGDISKEEFDIEIDECIDNGYKPGIIEINSFKRKQDGMIVTLGDGCYYIPHDDKKIGIVSKICPIYHQIRVDILTNNSFFHNLVIPRTKNNNVYSFKSD